MHSRIETIKAKGLKAYEPSNKVIFSENNPESEHYRKTSSEVFVKANLDTLDFIESVQLRSRARSVSLSSDMSSVLNLK